jgi:ribosomal silencing factor RsfS
MVSNKDSIRFKQCELLANKIIAKTFNIFADNIANLNISDQDKINKFILLAKSEVKKNMYNLKREENKLTTFTTC